MKRLEYADWIEKKRDWLKAEIPYDLSFDDWCEERYRDYCESFNDREPEDAE